MRTRMQAESPAELEMFEAVCEVEANGIRGSFSSGAGEVEVEVVGGSADSEVPRAAPAVAADSNEPTSTTTTAATATTTATGQHVSTSAPPGADLGRFVDGAGRLNVPAPPADLRAFSSTTVSRPSAQNAPLWATYMLKGLELRPTSSVRCMLPVGWGAPLTLRHTYLTHFTSGGGGATAGRNRVRAWGFCRTATNLVGDLFACTTAAVTRSVCLHHRSGDAFCQQRVREAGSIPCLM
jgi:hypothetical protein